VALPLTRVAVPIVPPPVKEKVMVPVGLFPKTEALNVNGSFVPGVGSERPMLVVLGRGAADRETVEELG